MTGKYDLVYKTGKKFDFHTLRTYQYQEKHIYSYSISTQKWNKCKIAAITWIKTLLGEGIEEKSSNSN